MLVKAERNNYATLDGLRGVAAIAVAILHMPHFFGGWHLPGSFLAVDLFFVMSGFVLCLAYESRIKSGLTPFQFMKIRIIRLYPLYLLSSFVGLIVAITSFFHSGLSIQWSTKLLLATVPFSAAMLPTPYVGQTNVLFPLNPVLWSIFYELLINLVYAIFFGFFSRINRLFVVVAVSAVSLIALVIHYDRLDAGFSWETMPIGFARVSFSFFLGVFIKKVSPNKPCKKGPLALLLVGASLLIFAIATDLWEQIVAVIFIFPVIVWMAVRVEPPKWAKCFNSVGTASYAIYALHKPAYQLVLGFLIIVLPLSPKTLSPWLGISFILLMLPFCIALDKFYDEPFRRWIYSKAGA